MHSSRRRPVNATSAPTSADVIRARILCCAVFLLRVSEPIFGWIGTRKWTVVWFDCLCIFALSAGFIFRSKLMWMRTLPSNVKLAIRLLQAMLQMMKSLGGGIYLFFSFPKSHCSNISVSLCVFLIHISWRCLFYVRDSDCVMSSQLVQPFFVVAWSPVLSYLSLSETTSQLP